jgi:hypothetical protein
MTDEKEKRVETIEKVKQSDPQSLVLEEET